MKNFARFPILFSALFITFNVLAQNKPGIITGKIIDSVSKNAIEFATVALLKPSDSTIITGAVTNVSGYFSINNIELEQPYLLRFSFVGYPNLYKGPIKLSATKPEIQLNEILLSSGELNANEVVITEERRMVVNQIDRKVFQVDKNITSEGGTAVDVLQNVPSVEVDVDGNISLRGSANVTVLIDGKPSGLTGVGRQAILAQIPANSIERIEVITNPSAKYDPDGMAGIINIVTKQNLKGGSNGMVMLSAGTRNKYNGTLQFGYRKNKWNLLTNYSGRYDERRFSGSSYRNNFLPDTSFTIDMTNSALHAYQSHVLKFGADFTPNQKHSFSTNLLFSYRLGNSLEKLDFNYLNNAGKLFLFSDRAGTSKTIGSGSADAGFRYSRQFKKPQQNFSIDANHSYSEGLDNALFDEYFYDPVKNNERVLHNRQSTASFDVSNITTLQADYAHPITENAKFEGGVKTILRNLQNNYELDGRYFLPEISNNYSKGFDFDFLFREQVYSAYSTYAQKFGKIGTQIGLRAEQALTSSELINVTERFVNNYFNFFPSAHIKYDLNKDNQFMASYSRRINRPHAHTLNPAIDYSDPQNLHQGNPFLQPEYINSYDLGYSRYFKAASFTTSTYYRETDNMITRIRDIDSNGVATITFQNLNAAKSYGLELVGDVRPYKWWSNTISSNIYRTEMSGKSGEAVLNAAGYGWSAKYMSTFKYKTKGDFQLSGWYRGPFPTVQGMIREMWSIDAAARANVLKNKGSLTFRVTDIFNTRRFAFESYVQYFYQEVVRKPESRVGYITFTYRFGKADEAKRMRKPNSIDGGGGGMDME